MMRRLPMRATIVAMSAHLPLPGGHAHDGAEGAKSRHRGLVWTLTVAASVLAVVAILTLWVQRQMLDNNAWKKATTQVIHDPQVRSALATYLVNQLYTNVNVEQALEERLPANAKQLAGPLAAALRQPATRSAEFVLERPRIQQAVITSSTLAHEKLVNVLENKTGFGIATGNGVVTVDLHDLVTELGAQLGLPADALARVPADAGVITIMRSDQLSAAQAGVQTIRILSVWALVLVLGMYAAAIYFAHGARRESLRNVGCALVLVGLVVLVARRFIGNYAIDQLAAPDYKGSVRDVWLIASSVLGQIGQATILYGAVAVAGAAFAGPTKIATTLRRRSAPVLNERPGIVALGAGVVYLLLLLWGPTHALRVWWGILLLAALAAGGIIALRRQTKAEFPAEPTMAVEAPKPGPSAAAEISRLTVLHDSGAISDDEFARAKALALSAR
jgi:hypothetical protein